MKLRYKIALALLWIFIVFYPNPFILFQSVERLSNPPLECPLDVNSLPSNPREIERFVTYYVKYDYDFKVYGVPWYIPEPKEIIEKKKGDCKSRAILLASILKKKGVPFSFKISPIHFWVDYEGKEETEFVKKFENSSAAIYSDGRWKLPEIVDIETYLKVWKRVLWDSMPVLRKLILMGGLILIFFDVRKLRKLNKIKN
ncbi:transglutaminase domain-containing protein [Archaeoglobales archaeon]|nr:MAG: transglutaminase domain-containing protein [Archaeoglobales archaeon]